MLEPYSSSRGKGLLLSDGARPSLQTFAMTECITGHRVNARIVAIQHRDEQM